MPAEAVRSYRDSRRRLLIDMQIPDGDPRFLRDFDAGAVIAQVRDARADAVMLYFQSHTGLCNWPTRTGRRHAAFRDRDVMAELLAAAQRHALPVCAYYSVSFNNAAWQDHPDWRLAPSKPAMIAGGLLQRERYGLCCLNHPDYRAFVRAQIAEMLEGYVVDAIFFDMVWWMSICLCPVCRDRYRRETGRDIPMTIDWLDPRWCEFQAARERWLVEFAVELRDTARRVRPGITVYHNFAVALGNWTRGLSFESAVAHDFLGGDFYGGHDEQYVVSRLMRNLSRRQPVEFMTTITANLAEHERLKSFELLRTQALAAASCGAAFLGILPVDPDGRLNDAALARIGRVFEETARFDADSGGTAIEQVAVYFSSESRMSFTDDGLPLERAPVDQPLDYPHLRAVQGACRVLQQAHLPFGVITRRQVGELARYRVLVLPNVLRMDAAEIDAIRAYVRGGGRVYASRLTSWTSTGGQRHADLQLGDLFGCQVEGIEPGRNVYLQPRDAGCAAAIAPERALSHWLDARQATGALRLAAQPSATVLASLTLPYGHPATGSVEGRDWSSIHSFPPWERTDRPMILEQDFGSGRAIYSAADLESGSTESHDALFLHLLRRLLGDDVATSCDAPPAVSMSVFEQPERQRWIVSFLHAPRDLPQQSPLPFRFQLRRDDGRRFVRLSRLPEGAPACFETTPTGALLATVDALQPFAMYAADYV
jgi:hypothetical protein